jgi:hypothetical protein
MQINPNNYSVIEILEMLEQKKLIVNRDYQRGGSLWPDAPSAYFIDTILEGFTFPKIYVYEYMDRSSRGLRKEIVDGQQRVGAIDRFYKDKFALRSEGALLHKACDARVSPFPRRTHPTASVTGMPRAV